MTAPLTVRNAEIRTATVEIRTLTITGKQVTLAVFRQLPEEGTFGKAGAVSWGWVNHCPDKACSPRHNRFGWDVQHRHVVWQKGAALRRTTVWDPDQYNGAGYERHLEIWRWALDLPQLFIAV